MMKTTVLKLRVLFISILVLAALFALLFECEVWLPGTALSGADASWMFLGQSLTQLLTIGFILLSLKLMRFKKVQAQIVTDCIHTEKNYLKWSILRNALLGLVLYLNLFFYYGTLDTAHAFLIVIVLLTMVFCWPSVDRMEAETHSQKDN